jgi:hypothetical protein
MVVWLLEYPKRSPWGQFLQACEAETLLIAAFLDFGSLADTAALIAKVCFVLFPDLRRRVIPQKRSPTALGYQEGLRLSTAQNSAPSLIAIGPFFACGSANALFSPGEFQESKNVGIEPPPA